MALLFVALFGGILTTMARFNSNEIRNNEARVAGWEAIEIAKAARLYVRDHLKNDANLRTALDGHPQRIYISDLKHDGYLSQSFGRVSGGSDVNALNQPIYIVMANWSANGLGGSATDPATVPTAFVFFDTSAQSSPTLMVQAVESARNLGASINAPLFDTLGNNQSAVCRSNGPAVGLWDTGCLQQSEYAQLATAMPGVSNAAIFPAGGLIVPVWKAEQPDLRAVMRFPQPENPGFATMLTDLQMGTPVAGCTGGAHEVMITTLDASGNTTSVPTGVCDVSDDDAAVNRRFNIDTAANLVAERVVAEAQTTDFGGESASIGTGNDEVMNISGDMTLGGDLRIYNRRVMRDGSINTALPAGAPARLDIPNGRLTLERNSYVYSLNNSARGVATVGTATAKSLISDTLTTPSFTSTANGTTTGAARMNVTNITNLNGDLTVRNGSGTGEVIADTISAPAATIRATDNTGKVQISQVLDMSGSGMTVNSGGVAPPNGYSALVGEITGAGTIYVNDDLQLEAGAGSISSNGISGYGGGAMGSISTAKCLESKNLAGGCPERQYVPPNITP